MVTAYSAGEAGCNGDNQHLIGVSVAKDVAHNRDQNCKGSPACTGGERQKQRNDEDNCRQEHVQSTGRSGHQVVYIVLCTQQTGHAGQRPCHGQNQDGRYHRFKAFGDTAGKFLEGHHAANHVEAECNNQCDHAAENQTHRGIRICKCVYKALAREESAGVDHADNTAGDQDSNRENQIDDLALWIGGFLVGVAIRPGFCGKEVSV